MKKHLLNKYLFIVIYFWYFFLIGCNQEEKPEVFVARVGNSILTESELKEMIDTLSYSVEMKNEVIHNWIETELLYQAALENDLHSSKSYKLRESENKKMLLAGMYLKEIFDNADFSVTENEIIEYFNKRKEEFILNEDLYKINRIVLKDYNKAVDLRNSISIKLDFKNSISKTVNPKDIIEVNYDLYLKDFELVPGELNDMIKNMLIGEITFPIILQERRIMLVQLVDKNEKGNLPKYEFVKDLILQKIKNKKEKELYKNLLFKLSEQNEIEVK